MKKVFLLMFFVNFICTIYIPSGLNGNCLLLTTKLYGTLGTYLPLLIRYCLPKYFVLWYFIIYLYNKSSDQFLKQNTFVETYRNKIEMYIIYSYQYASSICDVSCLCSLAIFHVLLCKWVLSEKYEEKKIRYRVC